MPIFNQYGPFFDLLEGQADAAVRAAKVFQSLSRDFGQATVLAENIKRIESEADDLTHQLVTKSNEQFMTPFDKEDMHTLSHALDDVTDHIEAAAARIVIYRLTTPRPDLSGLVDVLVQSVEASHEAVGILRHIKDHKPLEQIFRRIHELENKGDQGYRQALGDLFSEDKPDPLSVMKWKEVYDRIELTADACENVGDMLESVIVKYA